MKKKIALVVLAAVLLVAVAGTVVAGDLKVGQLVDCGVSDSGLGVAVWAEVTSVNRNGYATVKFHHENTTGRYIGWCRFTVTPVAYRIGPGVNNTVWHDNLAKTVSELVQGNLLTKGSFNLTFGANDVDFFFVSVEKR